MHIASVRTTEKVNNAKFLATGNAETAESLLSLATKSLQSKYRINLNVNTKQRGWGLLKCARRVFEFEFQNPTLINNGWHKPGVTWKAGRRCHSFERASQSNGTLLFQMLPPHHPTTQPPPPPPPHRATAAVVTPLIKREPRCIDSMTKCRRCPDRAGHAGIWMTYI